MWCIEWGKVSPSPSCVFLQVNSSRILMRATVRGLETAPDWCSPLWHSWTVQCWTRTEHFDWVTGTRALLGPGWQPPAVLHLTCDNEQRFWIYSVALLLIWGLRSRALVIIFLQGRYDMLMFGKCHCWVGGNQSGEGGGSWPLLRASSVSR